MSNKPLHDIDKTYVSPVDAFLAEFDATHEQTRSQQTERLKHQEIAMRRDNALVESVAEIWEGF